MLDLKIKNKVWLKILVLILVLFYKINANAQPITLIPEEKQENFPVEEILEEAFVINKLEDVNINNTGLFYENFDLWQNADYNNVAMILANLKADFEINIFYNIIKKLLTSSSNPPLNSKNFLFQRIKALMNIGMTSEAKQLIEIAGIKNFHKDVKLEINKLYLLASLVENNKICSELYSFELDSITSQKLGVICDLNNNQNEKALLKINLLREGGYQEEVFYNIVEYVTGASLSKPEIKDVMISPFNLMTALNSKDLMDILPETLEETWYYKILLSSDKTTILNKIKAGEKALALHIIDSEKLKNIYLQASFTKNDLNSPLTVAEKLSPEMGRALLYQAFVNRKSVMEKTSIIAKAFDLQNKKEAVTATALIYAPTINEITFSKNLEWFFDYAVVTMVYSNNISNISSVFNVEETLNSKKTPLFYILSDFWNINYNYEIDPETLKPIACYGLDEVLILKMENAIKSENIGEALLLASSLGKIISSKICPTYLKRILSLLKAGGFEQEANLIAYQTLIENSILLNW